VSSLSPRRLVIGTAVLVAGVTLVGSGVADAGRPPTHAYEIPNLTDVVNEIKAYYDGPDADSAGADADGAWGKEVSRADGEALAYLKRAVGRKPVRPAIVLDIDDTCVETESTYEIDNGFAYVGRIWYTYAYARKRFPAIRPTLNLAKWARAHGVEVFYVTGRRETSVKASNGVTYNIRTETVADLAAKGFPIDSAHLYLRPPADPNHSAVPYKSGIRQRIEGRGYHVIINVGDQWSDLAGGHAEKSVKLPNPMYKIA